MSSQNFCYWAQGFFEIGDAKTITKEQARIIKNHINLVKKCLESTSDAIKPQYPFSTEPNARC